jgi:DNA-binding HxlR family transcriptional regulator
MIVPEIGPNRAGRPWAPDARALEMMGDMWTLLIVRELSHGPRRRVELEEALATISSGALSNRLREMVASRLVTRQRFNEIPPRVVFELTRAGFELVPIIGAVARWAQRWAWSEPEPEEWVDLRSVFQLVPELAGTGPDRPAGIGAGEGVGGGGVHGEVELIVDTPEEPERYTMTLAEGSVDVEQEPAIDPAARIEGSQGAWVAAIAHNENGEPLKITGDEKLARQVLDTLSGPGPGPR